jgi:hypothetical protein
VDDLKRIHSNDIRGKIETAWKFWAQWILSHPSEQQKALTSELPPVTPDIMQFFDLVDSIADQRLKKIKEQSHIGLSLLKALEQSEKVQWARAQSQHAHKVELFKAFRSLLEAHVTDERIQENPISDRIAQDVTDAIDEDHE